MAIEITSLFRDILESPEQKQQRQMAEGFARSQNAVSQLTGLATAAAPLVGTMAELQGRRNEDLQRGVGRLLGRDVRSTSEKLQSALSQFNPQDPASVSQTTQMLQSMGLGAQAAQLASMSLEEQQKAKAQTEETALRGQQSSLNRLNLEKGELDVAAAKRSVGEDAALRTQQSALNELNLERGRLDVAAARGAVTDRATFRSAAARSINDSPMPAAQKSALLAQVAGGAFDSKPEELYNIISPPPIKVGDELVVRGANGKWERVLDTQGPSKTASLMSAATLQYGNNPEALTVVSDAINNGAITDAKQFKDFAPVSEGPKIPVSPAVEQFSIDSNERKYSAASTAGSIDTILSKIVESGAINSPAGIFSEIAEGVKDTLGLRDTVSQIRTAFTGEKNRDLIQGLPKGAASDRDITIFAKGYPPDNASVAEMVTWLEATQRTMYRVQDVQALTQQALSEQYNSGKPPTTIGIDRQIAPKMQAAEILYQIERELQAAVNSGAISPDDAQKQFSADLDAFQAQNNFTPSKYSE